MKAKKHFGQNFLIDNTVLEEISNAVFASDKDLIIEIGPGRGALTERLLKKNSELIAYEIDNDLKPYLNKLETNKFKVIYNDILTSDIKKDISEITYENLYLVGNLPYYITTPIIDHITKSNIKFNSFTIMIQKEVADRFLAAPGNKEYGYFTLFLNHFYNIERIINVKREAFSPAPKVLSSVVRLTPKNSDVIYEEEYFNFVKKCFKEKRKTLRNNLRDHDFEVIKNFLEQNGYNESARAEEISADNFYKLYTLLRA